MTTRLRHTPPTGTLLTINEAIGTFTRWSQDDQAVAYHVLAWTAHQYGPLTYRVADYGAVVAETADGTPVARLEPGLIFKRATSGYGGTRCPAPIGEVWDATTLSQHPVG